MSPRILVAGATGSIGRAVLSLLNEPARVLTRRPSDKGDDDVFVADALDATALKGAADGVDVVVSALGASVALRLTGRASYGTVDVKANLNLIDEAVRAGVRRFVYLGAHTGPGWDHTAYMKAHERVAEALAASPLSTTVVRPTGVFTALDDYLDMARRGTAQVIGDGTAKTNPIHPLDVAEAVVKYLDEGPENVPIGGPEVLTRRQIAETAFNALDKSPRVVTVPAFLPKTMSHMVRLFHPRLGDLIAFATAVSVSDAVAPSVGTRKLSDHYAELARGRSETQ